MGCVNILAWTGEECCLLYSKSYSHRPNPLAHLLAHLFLLHQVSMAHPHQRIHPPWGRHANTSSGFRNWSIYSLLISHSWTSRDSPAPAIETISPAPALYRELSIGATYGQLGVFNSIPGMTALGRNVQYVKKLNIGLNELVFYFNCVMVFEDLQSHTTTSSGAAIDTLTPQRPNWLPMPEDPLRNKLELVPLPPTTNLVDITFPFDVVANAYNLPSVNNSRTAMGHLCWILSLNPQLSRLYIDETPTLDPCGFRCFRKIVASLPSLTDLDIVIQTEDPAQFRFCSDIFFRCQ